MATADRWNVARGVSALGSRRFNPKKPSESPENSGQSPTSATVSTASAASAILHFCIALRCRTLMTLMAVGTR
jgi:hypothetical protein